MKDNVCEAALGGSHRFVVITHGEHIGRTYCTVCGTYKRVDSGNTAVKEAVNHPSHYTSGGIETITYLQAKLSPEEFTGFLKGNVLKYVSRAGSKGDALEDYKKAQWYVNRLVEFLNKA